MSSKIWIVAKREFLTRVQRKSFILVTLLTPIGIAVFMLFLGWIMNEGAKSEQRVLIRDSSGIVQAMNDPESPSPFDFSSRDLGRLKEEYISMGYDLLVHIPRSQDSSFSQLTVLYYGQEKPSLMLLESIESFIAGKIEAYRMRKSNIDQALLDSFRANVQMENGALDPGDPTGSAIAGRLNIIIGTVLGGIMGFLMYLVIFIYGSMVMRSVMEEKLSRIVEIMISSVRPIHLMMGKLIGVGGVGLTQLAIWAVLIPLLLVITSVFFTGGSPPQINSMGELSQIDQQSFEDFSAPQIIDAIFNLNWWLILPVFILFFLGGYFIYSSMFAAIGSAISEDMGEGQQLMLPIVIMVLIAFYMLFPVLSNPNGSLAVFSSLFPLFSPIIMPARLAFDPPWWQIVLSLVLMLLTVWFFIWLTGRIYRVGILMYGKKATIREMIKWLRYSG